MPPPFANSPFNETHEQVRATVKRFVEKHVRPHIHDWEEAGTTEIMKEIIAKQLGL